MDSSPSLSIMDSHQSPPLNVVASPQASPDPLQPSLNVNHPPLSPVPSFQFVPDAPSPPLNASLPPDDEFAETHGDIPVGLNPYPHEMLLPGLGTSSSNLTVSCSEAPAHKWNLGDETIDIGLKSSREHVDSSPHGTENIAAESCDDMNRESGRQLHERTWMEGTGEPSGPRQASETHNQAESKWWSAADSYDRPGFSGASSSNELLKQLDSSDNSDGMDDVDVAGKLRPSKAPMSKNLVSERRRRKKLNERLYSLRAVVPTISKMDKASIVGDAINYVRDLQKQVEEMQADIASLEAHVAVGDTGCVIQRASLANSHRKKPVRSHEIVELEVSQMGEQTFHLRIHCKKSPGVLVHLTRALEALDFEILNANLTLVNELVLNTILVEVKNGMVINPEELRQMTLAVVPRFGLFTYSL